MNKIYMPFRSKDFNLISISVEMTMLRSFYPILILHVALTLVMVHTQDDQSGFISIDCGIPQGSKYTDIETGINYVSDAGFIEGGINREILPAYRSATNVLQLSTLRSFPENIRNCYTLRPKQGKNNRYLIRLRFFYGNYDSLGQLPEFDIYLGADLWISFYIDDPSTGYYYELIHLASSDYINICFVNTGQGTPFISSIELRLLDITMYETNFPSLQFFGRYSFGSNERVRYVDDKYDRFWNSMTLPGCRVVETSGIVSSGPERVPSKVMNIANTPTNSTDAISYTWNATITGKYIIYVHFAEFEILKSDQKREFNFYMNGNYNSGPFSPLTRITTLYNTVPYTGSLSYTLEINKTSNSTLPPIINAIEIFMTTEFQQQKTEDQDAASIWNTKSTYGLKRNWQGDPCVPQSFLWDGINCNYNDLTNTRIISLNLSSSGLSGEIATALANLTMIESLDLSYNNLTGNVPEFLAQRETLRILDLRGNNFTRPLPAELLEKSKKGSLFLSIEAISDEDKSSCLEGSCRNNKRNKGVIAAISTLSVLLVLLITLAILLIIKRRKTQDLIIKDDLLKPRNQQFTYSEVQSITNNFKTVIGRGGFGTVYLGHNGDNQVAVKMLSESSAQGYNEFQAEVKLLMDISHRNITSLVGYCNNSSHKGIIYELMANGNLEKHLFDGSRNVLSWERRLQIGCDAAEGLAYMHHGCRPPVVHRDVKCSNILLDESFQAKLADFGLSRAFTTEDATHISTMAVGTRGYLDPEYYATNRLTEKSDVYSFGIVLLELITSRRALSKDIYIINWVKSMVEQGSVENIIDPRLDGVFNGNIAWKVVELAIACVSYSSNERPSMNDVVIDLKQCLQAEIAKTRLEKPNNQSGYMSLDLENDSGPYPR